MRQTEETQKYLKQAFRARNDEHKRDERQKREEKERIDNDEKARQRK